MASRRRLASDSRADRMPAQSGMYQTPGRPSHGTRSVRAASGARSVPTSERKSETPGCSGAFRTAESLDFLSIVREN